MSTKERRTKRKAAPRRRLPQQERQARPGRGTSTRIAETKGPEYWRSLEELAGSADFQEMMHREFPKGASEWLDAVSRRGFLKLMGASLAHGRA